MLSLTYHEPIGTAKGAGVKAPTRADRETRQVMKPQLDGFMLVMMAPPGFDRACEPGKWE